MKFKLEDKDLPKKSPRRRREDRYEDSRESYTPITWNMILDLLEENKEREFTNKEIAEIFNANPIRVMHLTCCMHEAGEIVPRANKDRYTARTLFFSHKGK